MKKNFFYYHLVAISGFFVLFGLFVVICLYPYPYFLTSKAYYIFGITVVGGLAGGPMLTFIVCMRPRTNFEYKFDMAVVVILQLGLVFSGCYSLYIARPLYLSFEFDRFRVVHFNEIAWDYRGDVVNIDGEFNCCEVGVIGSVVPTDGLLLGLAASVDVYSSFFPGTWRGFDEVRNDVLSAAKPIDDRLAVYILNNSSIFGRKYSNSQLKSYHYLPLFDKKVIWIVLYDIKNKFIVDYLPVDPFFDGS